VLKRTESTASATTFRLFLVVVDAAAAKRHTQDEVPVQHTQYRHWCSGAPPETNLVNGHLVPIAVGDLLDDVFPSTQRVAWREFTTGRCPFCGKDVAEIQESALVDLGTATEANLRDWVAEAEKIWTGEVDSAASGVDTRHYDDGHASGWKPKHDEVFKIDYQAIERAARTSTRS
jgi:hypothetical protein